MEATPMKRRYEAFTSFHTNGSETNQAKRRKEDEALHYNPRAINVAQFAIARATELKKVEKKLQNRKSDKSHKVDHQHLPRHMRRRAMSNNIKRLPCRLRLAAQMKQAKLKKQGEAHAKKSRRQRRRPSNLRKEFERRQRKKMWLETHLWHAKRFKMMQRWGYCLPLHASDKSVRASYRGVSQYCTIQDISFNEVLELSGLQDDILDGLGLLTKQETGLTFKAAAFLPGQRHGEVTLYHRDCYPNQAIGPVSFLWQVAAPGSIEEEGNLRHLWLWIHPAIFNEVLQAVKKVVADKSSVEVKDLRGQLLLFRLQGPHAHSIVMDALKVSTVAPLNDNEEGTSELPYWWQKHFKIEQNMNIHSQQKNLWKLLRSAQSTTDLPSSCVIGLTVRDPRILLPVKRQSVSSDTSTALPKIPLKFQPDISSSAIWDKSIRDNLQDTMQPTHEINQLRSDFLVPGSPLELGDKESRIPILLLQRPGMQHRQTSMSVSQESPLGYGGGWDVVIPKKWGSLFWVGFIYRGARAVGIRESHNVVLHQGRPRFPEDFPDTKEGEKYNSEIEKEQEEQFLRRPPAKRPNYAKLGFVTPFRCPWKKLILEWSERSSGDQMVTSKQVSNQDKVPQSCDSENVFRTFYVLRNKRLLLQLNSNFVKSNAHKARTTCKAKASPYMRGPDINNKHEYSSGITGMISTHPNALVWVQLSMVLRGDPAAFSMICIPRNEDLVKLRKDKSYLGPQEAIKKQFTLDKKKKKKSKITKEGSPKEPLKERLDKVNILELNSRLIVGYVTNGSHTFGTGRGSCVGYCCMMGLNELLQSQPQRPLLVLVRDTKSLQYRFANVSISV